MNDDKLKKILKNSKEKVSRQWSGSDDLLRKIESPQRLLSSSKLRWATGAVVMSLVVLLSVNLLKNSPVVSEDDIFDLLDDYSVALEVEEIEDDLYTDDDLVADETDYEDEEEFDYLVKYDPDGELEEVFEAYDELTELL